MQMLTPRYAMQVMLLVLVFCGVIMLSFCLPPPLRPLIPGSHMHALYF